MASHYAGLTRRDFLARVPAATAFLIAHEKLVRTAAAFDIPKPFSGNTAFSGSNPRIRKLRLLTAVPLAKMRDFYCDTIGFPVLEEKPSEITLGAGATTLTFVSAIQEQLRGRGGRGRGEPMYHFAFNIPRNKILSARKWQLERTSLVPPRGDAVAQSMPKDVWDFRHWNAHSIFFFDPAFNIVEYIARHTLHNDADNPDVFGPPDIHYASEIGYVFEEKDRDDAIGMLRTHLGLREYPRGAEPWAMGDERGLLLCLFRKGQRWGENTKTPVTWDVFPTEASVAGDKPDTFKFDGFPYTVRVE